MRESAQIISILASLAFLNACSEEMSSSQYKNQDVLVSKIIAAQKSVQQIAECTVWTDRALNDNDVVIPKEMQKNSQFSQMVWIEAAQGNVEFPNSGRVTDNHFDYYNSFRDEVVKVSAPADILSAHLDCMEQVAFAAGGIEKILKASN